MEVRCDFRGHTSLGIDAAQITIVVQPTLSKGMVLHSPVS